MAQQAYKLHQVVLNATTIKGIESSNVTNSLSQYMLQGGGSLDPFGIVSLKSDQAINFVTTDFVTMLGVSGITPFTITGAGVKAYFRQLADGGVFTGGANDVLATSLKGRVHITGFSATQFGNASLNVSVIPTFDGTNSPVNITTGATSPTLAVDTDLFTLGTLSINSVLVPISSVSYDSGFKFESMGADGQPFNTEVFSLARNPKFTFTIHNASLPVTISKLIGNSTGGDVIFYLRKYSLGGGMVPDATAQHIKFTMKAGMIHSEGITAQNLSVASLQIIVTPSFNGTDPIVAINTASAIT